MAIAATSKQTGAGAYVWITLPVFRCSLNLYFSWCLFYATMLFTNTPDFHDQASLKLRQTLFRTQMLCETKIQVSAAQKTLPV